MKMSLQMQKRAKAAFQQGITDEDNGRYASARLRIDEKVRDFYDAARKQRAAQLRPHREVEEAERNERIRIAEAAVEARLVAAIPAIKQKLDAGDGLGAIRLVLNAEIGI
jgi:hypothetical protein